MDYYNYGTPNMSPYLATNQFQNLQSQPNNMQALTPQMQDNRFVYIQGREAAKAYPVSPNTTVLFLDDQNPYAYRKTTDRDGRTIEFKVFRLEEEIEPEPTSMFATKDDLNSLQGSIEELKSLLLQQKYPQPKPYQGKKVNGNA